MAPHHYLLILFCPKKIIFTKLLIGDTGHLLVILPILANCISPVQESRLSVETRLKTNLQARSEYLMEFLRYWGVRRREIALLCLIYQKKR